MKLRRICAALAVAAAPWAVAAPDAAIEGQPWPRHAIDASSDGADGVRLLDVNGDALLDIATGWEEGGVIRVYLHPGYEKAREAWPSITAGSVDNVEDAVLADIDGDGAVDVVSATEGADRSIYLHFAPGDAASYDDTAAWTTAVLPESQGRRWMFTVPWQVDGKNGLDIVAAGKNDDAWIGWFEAPPDPRDAAAWRWHPIQPAAWIMTVDLVDMNGDEHADILYSERRGDESGVWWLENPGAENAARTWTRHPVGAMGREVMFIDRNELDGRMTIAAAIKDGPVVLLEQDAPGAWHERTIPMPASTGTGKAVRIGDIDVDGHDDIAVSCENARGLHGVFVLHGPDWRATAVSGLEGVKYDLVQLIDVDGDGDLDILTCEEADNLGVIWYENPLK